MMKPCAVISQISPRYEDWMYILGSPEAPIVSPCTVMATAPGLPAPKAFYRLDVTRLTVDQRSRLIERISEKWHLKPSEVEKDISSEHGIPILADDVTLVVDGRIAL